MYPDVGTKERVPVHRAFLYDGQENHRPGTPTISSASSKMLKEADVAQLVEQPIRNRQVTGSSPVVGSSRFPLLKKNQV